MSHRLRIPNVAAAGLLTVACATAMLLSACKSQGRQSGDDADDKTTVSNGPKSPAQISVVNGESVMTLDPDTQNRLGLSVAPLATTTSRAQQTFPAVVLSTTDLASSHGNYLAAQAQLQKARVEEGVANKEYERLKSLYAEDQNISQKSLEAAEGSEQAAETDVSAAQQQVDLQKSLIGQQWGSTIATWAQQDTPAFERVLDQRDALVQVTVPADTSLAPPKGVAIENLDRGKTEASFVSSFPRVDPRVQGRSYLYLMSPHAPVAPETSLVADVTMGGEMKGVIVPTAAVVWSEGRAWVYQQTAANAFTRRAVSTNLPLNNGYFVSEGVRLSDKVVTVGAQALLSEEFLLRGASAGTNDD